MYCTYPLTKESRNDISEAHDEVDVHSLDIGGLWQPGLSPHEEESDGQDAGQPHAHLGAAVALAQPETGKSHQDDQGAGGEDLVGNAA